ncbi:hypothetical protein [Amycolatopsis vastitatis]|uniref:hypothetical protein n=1 Tax=Amycolatopsis vastitatis TaxID=1905142 RepID=UPI001178BA85|nr:hypothetical protein [Amycolatopsis vastitatis]
MAVSEPRSNSARRRRLYNGIRHASAVVAVENKKVEDKKPFRETGSFTVLVSTGASLLVAVVASLTTIITTNATIDKDREIQQRQIDSQKADASRAKREVVYKAYLDAANQYSVATNHLLDGCTPQPNVPIESLYSKCPAANEFNSARSNYQDRLNDMYIFATPTAIQAARALSTVLPPGLVSSFTNSTITRPDRGTFLYLYQLAETQTCLDVKIDPGQPCFW